MNKQALISCWIASVTLAATAHCAVLAEENTQQIPSTATTTMENIEQTQPTPAKAEDDAEHTHPSPDRATETTDQALPATAAPEDQTEHIHPAPTDTVGTHLHHGHGAKGWMFEYRLMNMLMKGNIIGTNNISVPTLTQKADPSGLNAGTSGFMMAGTKMSMQMHMLMGMHSLGENTTAMLMFNYLQNTMDMVTNDNRESTMVTAGTGDTLIGVMYQANPRVNTAISLSLPTGSIEEKVKMVMPLGGTHNTRAPYQLQLGSGTFDVLPSITYAAKVNHLAWKTQATYTYHLGRNSEGYAFGDKIEWDNSLHFNFSKKLSTLLRGKFLWQDKIGGEDSRILQKMSAPTAPVAGAPPVGDHGDHGDGGSGSGPQSLTSPDTAPNGQGGAEFDLLWGMTFLPLKNHLLGFEIGIPVYQDLNGPQMNTHLLINFSYQAVF